jgi:hypothetical protein
MAQAIIVKAWNAWRRGDDDVTAYQWRAGGTSPEPFPVPQ